MSEPTEIQFGVENDPDHDEKKKWTVVLTCIDKSPLTLGTICWHFGPDQYTFRSRTPTMFFREAELSTIAQFLHTQNEGVPK